MCRPSQIGNLRSQHSACKFYLFGFSLHCFSGAHNLSSLDPSSLVPSLTSPLPTEESHLLSQTLTVSIPWPINDSAPNPPSQIGLTDSQTSRMNLGAGAASSSSESLVESQFLSTHAISLQMAPPNQELIHPPLTQASNVTYDPAMTQLRRGNERLRTRLQRAEGQVTELQEASQAARREIGLADTLLEHLMDSQDISTEIYQSLTKLSKLLDTASGRLRGGGGVSGITMPE